MGFPGVSAQIRHKALFVIKMCEKNLHENVLSLGLKKSKTCNHLNNTMFGDECIRHADENDYRVMYTERQEEKCSLLLCAYATGDYKCMSILIYC